MNIESRLKTCDVSGYLRPIDTSGWVSYRDPRFDVNSASLSGARFNRDGQVAYYIASGIETAQLNVGDWRSKILCTVAPQVLNFFDLPMFAADQGISADYLKSKERGGYPLPQETADLLLEKYGITGCLFSSYADFVAGRSGLCAVIRPQDGRFVGDEFFVR
jgi:hypothetical protein